MSSEPFFVQTGKIWYNLHVTDRRDLFQRFLKLYYGLVAESEEGTMKNFLIKASKVVAALALVVTTCTVNSACAIWMYQPELPEGVDSLRQE